MRTTPDLVRGIIQVGSVVDLSPFIAIANQITTDVCTYPHPGQDPAVFLPYTDGFVDSKMELIERWLAAHYYTIFSNQLDEAEAGPVAVKFRYKIDFMLKNSMYGQSAMMLDTYGGLAGLANSLDMKRNITVRMAWLGREMDAFGHYIDDTVITR